LAGYRSQVSDETGDRVRRFLTRFGLGLLLLSGLLIVFTKWDHFKSPKLIIAQASLLEFVGYFRASDTVFRRSGFREMFLNPDDFKEKLDRVLLDDQSSEAELKLAGDLIQCRTRDALYQLAAELQDRFGKEDAALRLKYIFMPSSQASTYIYREPLDSIYREWLRIIQQLDREDIFPEGLEEYLNSGANFFAGTNPNPQVQYSPVVVCPNEINVADMSARLKYKN
jgi:hypothetical protein